MQSGDVGKACDPGGVGLQGSAVEQGQESGATVAPTKRLDGGNLRVAKGGIQRRGALGVRATKLAVAQGGLGGDDGVKPPRG